MLDLIKKLKKISACYNEKKCNIFVFKKSFFINQKSKLLKLYSKNLFRVVKNINYKIFIPYKNKVFRIEEIINEIFSYYSNCIDYEKILNILKKLNLTKSEINFSYELYSYKILKLNEKTEKNIKFIYFFNNFNKINKKFNKIEKIKKYNNSRNVNFLCLGDLYFFVANNGYNTSGFEQINFQNKNAFFVKPHNLSLTFKEKNLFENDNFIHAKSCTKLSDFNSKIFVGFSSNKSLKMSAQLTDAKNEKITLGIDLINFKNYKKINAKSMLFFYDDFELLVSIKTNCVSSVNVIENFFQFVLISLNQTATIELEIECNKENTNNFLRTDEYEKLILNLKTISSVPVFSEPVFSNIKILRLFSEYDLQKQLTFNSNLLKYFNFEIENLKFFELTFKQQKVLELLQKKEAKDLPVCVSYSEQIFCERKKQIFNFAKNEKIIYAKKLTKYIFTLNTCFYKIKTCKNFVQVDNYLFGESFFINFSTSNFVLKECYGLLEFSFFSEDVFICVSLKTQTANGRLFAKSKIEMKKQIKLDFCYCELSKNKLIELMSEFSFCGLEKMIIRNFFCDVKSLLISPRSLSEEEQEFYAFSLICNKNLEKLLKDNEIASFLLNYVWNVKKTSKMIFLEIVNKLIDFCQDEEIKLRLISIKNYQFKFLKNSTFDLMVCGQRENISKLSSLEKIMLYFYFVNYVYVFNVENNYLTYSVKDNVFLTNFLVLGFGAKSIELNLHKKNETMNYVQVNNVNYLGLSKIYVNSSVLHIGV